MCAPEYVGSSRHISAANFALPPFPAPGSTLCGQSPFVVWMMICRTQLVGRTLLSLPLSRHHDASLPLMMSRPGTGTSLPLTSRPGISRPPVLSRPRRTTISHVSGGSPGAALDARAQRALRLARRDPRHAALHYAPRTHRRSIALFRIARRAANQLPGIAPPRRQALNSAAEIQPRPLPPRSAGAQITDWMIDSDPQWPAHGALWVT